MYDIRKFRQERGVTQAELAKNIGVSRSTIAKYENGERKPTLSTLQKISNFLKIPISEFGIDLPNGLKILTLEEALSEKFENCVFGFGDTSSVQKKYPANSSLFKAPTSELNDFQVKNMLIDSIIYFFNKNNLFPSFEELEAIEKEVEEYILFKAYLKK